MTIVPHEKIDPSRSIIEPHVSWTLPLLVKLNPFVGIFYCFKKYFYYNDLVFKLWRQVNKCYFGRVVKLDVTKKTI
jgi:hypothetical protein